MKGKERRERERERERERGEIQFVPKAHNTRKKCAVAEQREGTRRRRRSEQ